ncbi:acetyl-CoA carboxylase [Furfurilactobacillus milii]|uniref:Acetyl-CoA carboxylase n=1 Tax=Furfurilactobacillus rossiae TaxID=231049 RepID=A0A7C9MPP4_9LACO|nr:acetyl-CoA carboxylase [Furfurilactobacillus milii]MYV05243.1 acetyl-CoA carboxylase [Furfurilactobacillus milii]
MNKDLDLICQRIDELFLRQYNTRYWLQIVDDPYDKTYNFFFDSLKKAHREKSVPLHTVTIYDLTYLEELVEDIQKHTQLSIQFEGFTGQHWPKSQRIIQRKKHWDE